jgi:hypothetical protein
VFTGVVTQSCQSCLFPLSNWRALAWLGSLQLYSAQQGETPREGGVYRVMRRPRHTAPFLRLFIPNSLTVHCRSFSLKALPAACSFCPATSCSDYSLAVTSSAPFLGLFVPNNSMVQCRYHFHSSHSSIINSLSLGRLVLLCYRFLQHGPFFLFPFLRGPTPPQCPIHGLLFRRALIS